MLPRRFWDDKRPPALLRGPGQREEGAVGIVRVEGVEGGARAEGVGRGVGREGIAQLPRLVRGTRRAEWRRLRAIRLAALFGRRGRATAAHVGDTTRSRV